MFDEVGCFEIGQGNVDGDFDGYAAFCFVVLESWRELGELIFVDNNVELEVSWDLVGH